MRFLFLVVLAACGSQQAPPQTQTPAPSQTQTQTQTQALTPSLAPTTCKTSEDCVITTTRACCQACRPEPFADVASADAARRKQCALVECAPRSPEECKPTSSVHDYHAECRNASCVAVHDSSPPPSVAPATLESAAPCSNDGECIVTNTPSCCAGCQASAYVTSQREAAERRRRCATVDCSIDRTQPCEPIVDAALYRAVCRARTCAAVKR